MKRSVLLLSVVLLAYSGSVQADGIGMSYAGMSISSFQVSMSTPGVFLAPGSSLLLIPATMHILSPAIMLLPTPSPLMVMNSAAILAGSVSVQPTASMALLATQMSMTTAGHDVAMSIITNMK